MESTERATRIRLAYLANWLAYRCICVFTFVSSYRAFTASKSNLSLSMYLPDFGFGADLLAGCFGRHVSQSN